MKKRLTALLLLVCMLLTMVPMGAWAEEEVDTQEVNENNEGEAHTHTWGPWVAGDTQHTHTCTDGDATESFDHTYPEAWTAGSDSHTKKCTVCDKVISEDHTWGKWTSTGNNTHERTCSVCGAKEKGSCTGSATCAALGECSVCHAQYTVPHSTEYTYEAIDGSTHKVKCKVCGTELKTETCDYTEANCHAKATCKKCGYEKGEVDSSKHDGEVTYQHIPSTTNHALVCQGCNAVLDTESCTIGTPATCQASAKCAKCNSDIGDPDPTKHVVKSDATCTKKAVCALCGEFGEPLGHDRDKNNPTDPCKRIESGTCDCTTDHASLWTAENASKSSINCPECGKEIDKTSISNVTFTITGFGIGKPVNGIGATSSDSRVKVAKVTAASQTKAADDTFQAGTEYNVTITYSVDPGYVLQTATINGQKYELNIDGNSVSATLGTPAQLYTITYAHKGMDEKDIKDVTFSSTLPTEYAAASLPLTLPTGTHPGYTFKGWTGTGVKDGKIVSGTTGDLTLTANWEKKTYKVTVLKNSGDTKSYAEYNVKYGEKCPTPKTPTADDQVFDCWKKDGAKYDFSKAVTGDMTLIASWKDAGYIKFHNCSYGTRTYAVGSNVNLSKDIKKPVKNGYYFCGWYSDSALKKVSSSTIKIKTKGEVIHVYAKWKKMDTTNPKTGDTARPELALGILAASGICLGAVTVLSKKKRRF